MATETRTDAGNGTQKAEGPVNRLADVAAMPQTALDVLKHATAGKSSAKPEKGVSIQLPGLCITTDPGTLCRVMVGCESVGFSVKVPMPAGSLDHKVQVPGKVASHYLEVTYKRAQLDDDKQSIHLA